jgi:sugar transferase (PEP-CTERM/EpsH1 system associated)
VRILFLTHRLPYAPNRGDRIRAYHLLRTFAQMAHVDLLSLVHDEEEASHADELRRWVHSVTVARVPRFRNRARALVALPGSTPLTHILLDSPEVRPALRAICAAAPPDIAIAYCSGMAQYLLEPSLRDLPAIVDMVDVDSKKWAELAATEPIPKRWVLAREARTLRRFEAAVAGHASASLTVNEREHEALSQIAPAARVVTIPNGIDRQHFAPPSAPTAEPVVVFCGVLSYAPNERGALWMAREVWPLIREAKPGARFQIVGAEPTAALRALEREDDSISVAGSVPDVRQYLWSAAVAVAPLMVARGLQNKVLEAVAAGLPCVVTPPVAQGLPREVLRACLAADAREAFAAAVISLLDLSPIERRRRALTVDMTDLDWSTRLGPVRAMVERAAAGKMHE